MSLYKRFLRWRGHDTTKVHTVKLNRYEYTIEHVNGDVSRPQGHGKVLSNGFIKTKKVSKFKHIGSMGVFAIRTTDRIFDGVKEISKERVGVDEWEVVVDMADGRVKEYNKVEQ